MNDHESTDPTTDDGLWLPIAELARQKGKARQTVHERVAQLERDGLLTTRQGPGGTRQVNVAEYDAAVKETTDFSRQQSAETTRANAEGGDWGDSRLRDAQRQKVQYEAALKSIELKRAVGSLVEITQVNEVVAAIGEELKKPLDLLPLRAEEITAAAVSSGSSAVRKLLTDIVFDLRTKFTEALRRLDIRGQGGTA